MTTQTSTRRAFALVFFIMLLDVIGITIIAPIAPYIVQRYSDDALAVSLLTVIYAAAQFVAAPVLGKLGDRYGRRPVLLWSVLGSAVGYLIFGFAGALWLLLVSRAIDGVSGGNLSTASAYIADKSTPETLTKNFTLIGIAWGVGMILGPSLGAVFGQISLEAPAFVAAGLSLISVILGFFFLPESLPPEKRETKPLRLHDFNPFASIGEIARKPRLERLLLAYCLFTFAFNGINSTETLFMIQKFAAEPWQIGVVLALVGVAVIIVVWGLAARVVARFGDKSVAIASLLLHGIGLLLAFFAPFLWLIFGLKTLNNGISAFTYPTLTTLMTGSVSPREVGVLMGVTTALNSLMSVLGPLWAGIIYDHAFPGAPYWSGAIIFALAALLLKQARVDERA
jgi:DHA1 family tetracycline resistance protein-like MFS transporter